MTATSLRLTVAVAALSLGFVGFAQDNAAKSMAADKNFAMLADESNSAEIAQSQIALKKSSNPDIRAYAQKMIDDHMKLRADMKPFNDQMSVYAPQPLSANHKVVVQRLSQLSGKKFDMEYVKNMDVDHHKALGLFNNEIATTTNDALKAAVQQGQTVIQQHTDMADQMAGKMNIPVATSGA